MNFSFKLMKGGSLFDFNQLCFKKKLQINSLAKPSQAPWRAKRNFQLDFSHDLKLFHQSCSIK